MIKMKNKSQLKRKKRFHIFRDMHFWQGMILIFVIGCIIPLLGASIYTNSQTRKMMINLSKETQLEETALLGSSISESMKVLDNVARLLCLNEEIQQLATKKYSSGTEFFKDYYNTSAISDYLNFYQQDISYINVYLANDSIRKIYLPNDSDKESDLANDSTLVEKKENATNIDYLNPSLRAQMWCKKAMELHDRGYWSYGSAPDSDQQSIQISRAMRDEKGNTIAVVVVLMQYNKTADAIMKRNVDTVLLYNDSNVVEANYDADNKYPFLRGRLDHFSTNLFSEKMVYGVEEYLVTYNKVIPSDSSNYYSLVSIQKYQDIMSNVNQITLNAFWPEMLGILLSVILIFGFAISYGGRMNLLRQQMSLVARGEYDKVEPIEGNDEIGELYQELEQMMKDIQKLMNRVVEEQVQKEKLHTRQKEVEFKMLASQINPHFLYNTLETIRMKAMVNKQPEIAELVMMLAKTMRYNIHVSDQMVRLKDELQMVEYYLKIQEYRFGDRISSEMEVDAEVDRNALVMPLIIQPFVENAFVHGLEEKDRDGKLCIHVCMKEGDILIKIRDNGKGMDYYELGELRKSLHEETVDRTHIGIHNVNQRIKIKYGENYGIQIDSKEKYGTKVIIRVPYHLGEDENL